MKISFIAFRLSRPLRTVQRPDYILFYQPKETTPEIIVSLQEAKQWLNETNSNIFTKQSSHQSHMNFSTSDEVLSPVPSLILPKQNQRSFVHMSSRRAGCNHLFPLNFPSYLLLLFQGHPG